MRRLSTFLALMLVAIWLPVTQHCGLEGAGLIARQCASDCTSGRTGADDCCAVEKAQCKLGNDTIKVPAPEILSSVPLLNVCLISLTAKVGTADLPVDSFERPQNWIPSWQFTRRAAPPSRAPTSLFA